MNATAVATQTEPVSAQEAYEIGLEAYVYFYALITMDLTRRVSTNVEAGKTPGFGPLNTFSHFRAYPTADFKAVVRPNFDTLYSLAWLDLTQEPIIISAPDTAGRYYLLPNGWQMNTDTMGVYGDYYLKRAIVAMLGLGANQPEDAIYPLNLGDADGKPLKGEGKYVHHFNKEELPPVSAFWSITMYDSAGFQVANPLNRFAIGDRDELAYNADGSLDLYLQNESPGSEKESNWLPSPATDALGVTMRLYAPKPEALDGRWNPPAIRRVH